VSSAITMPQLMVDIRSDKTIVKVLQVYFYWPTLFKDVKTFITGCEMPQSGILEVELFDVWAIDFMGPFPSSHNHLYILMAVDYIFK